MSLEDWFTPSQDFYECKFPDGTWCRAGKSFIEKLDTHPEITKQPEIADVLIDDPFNIEQEWVNKLRALDCPKKKRKLKQQMPYWANNWRKK